MEQTDILISGAGIAGLVAAAGLAQRGFRVCIVDPAPPVDDVAQAGSDLRSTAYLRPAQALLARLGLWDALKPEAQPLAALQVIDTHGTPPVERARRMFSPSDVESELFGWNLPNWRCRAILATHLASLPGVDLRLGVGFVSMLTRDAGARVVLSDGTSIAARLVIGADGRASSVRQAAGIGVRVRRYGQKALSFAAAHDLPHEDVSSEIYNSGGAFTTVPLADHQGEPASAIVWMQDGPRALELAGMARDDGACFDAEMSARAVHLLGNMRRITPVQVWPVVTQTADRMIARRVALIAEAAHVLPPIGAQGLNTSLQDVAALLDRLDDDPGAPAGLERYSADRLRDVAARASAIDLFNRVCQSDLAAVQALRLAGLRAVHDMAPLRKQVMQAGMGRDVPGVLPDAPRS